MRSLICLLLVASAATAQDFAHLPALAEGKHPWMEIVFDQQNKAGYPLLAWKATGDQAYLDEAVAQLLNPKFVPVFANRAVVANYGFFYRWLFRELGPHLTPEQYDELALRMANWEAVAVARPDMGDTDEMLGNRYFLLVKSPDWLITRCDQLTETATAGGEWFTGTGYEPHDLQLMLMGAVLDGLDKHPKVAAFAREASEQLLWKCTTDRSDMVQWGDLQAPNRHNIRRHNWVPVVALLYAVGQDPRMLDLLAELTAGEKPNNIGEMTYVLPFLDPRLLPEVPVNHNPQGLRTSPATGLSIYRKGDWIVQHHATVSPPLRVPGWGNASWPVEFFDEQGGAYYLHHAAPGGAGDVRIWNGKEWSLGHPLAYGTPPDWSNVGLFGGYSVTHLRGLGSVQQTETGFKATGWIDGKYMRGPDRGNPAPFLKQYTRDVEYKHPGYLRVRDTFDYLKRPEQTDGWSKVEWESIAAAPALSQQVWHCQSEPIKREGGWEFVSFGGERVRIVPSRPVDSIVELREGTQAEWGGWFGDTHTLRLLDDRVREDNGGPIVIESEVFVGVQVPEPPPPPTLSIEQRVERLEALLKALQKTIEKSFETAL